MTWSTWSYIHKSETRGPEAPKPRRGSTPEVGTIFKLPTKKTEVIGEKLNIVLNKLPQRRKGVLAVTMTDSPHKQWMVWRTILSPFNKISAPAAVLEASGPRLQKSGVFLHRIWSKAAPKTKPKTWKVYTSWHLRYGSRLARVPKMDDWMEYSKGM